MQNVLRQEILHLDMSVVTPAACCGIANFEVRLQNETFLKVFSAFEESPFSSTLVGSRHTKDFLYSLI